MAVEKPPKKTLVEKLKAGASAAIGFVKGVASFDAFASFRSEGKEITFPIDFDGDTVWATQAQMADLFGVTKQNISLHLKNLFETNELEESSVVKDSLTTAADGKAYRTTFYNLDAILAVGFKVNSKKAVAFRKWAATVLKGYIQDGYALNGKRLNSDPAALLKLAQEVRAIRTSEKNLYTQVRETFAHCSIDYDKDDPAARTFFATCQDSFHYAASEKTAVQLIMSRADAEAPNMGLTALGNRKPTSGTLQWPRTTAPPKNSRRCSLSGTLGCSMPKAWPCKVSRCRWRDFLRNSRSLLLNTSSPSSLAMQTTDHAAPTQTSSRRSSLSCLTGAVRLSRLRPNKPCRERRLAPPLPPRLRLAKRPKAHAALLLHHTHLAASLDLPERLNGLINNRVAQRRVGRV